MKAYDNGTYRDMTTEEITDIERHHAEETDPEPTPEERIAALEAQQNDTDALLVELAYTQTLLELGVI